MRRRDEKHLAFVRTLACACCGDNTSVEAAHIRMSDARIAKPATGIAIKPDDRFVLPLCSRCHREQHAGSERKFWECRDKDPVLLSLALHSVSGDAGEAQRILFGAQQPIWAAG